MVCAVQQMSSPPSDLVSTCDVKRIGACGTSWLGLRRGADAHAGQFDSDDFSRWCKDNQFVPSMSRRGNCWGIAVTESFFCSLKKERIKRHIYATRRDAKSDVFDYIEGFYNRVRRHSHLDQLNPLAFEQLRTGS